MTSMLGKIFGARAEPPTPTRGDIAYATVMNASDDLLKRMRDTSKSTDAARAVMSDIWAQNHNVPFMTAVIETVQEMKAPIEQRPEDLP